MFPDPIMEDIKVALLINDKTPITHRVICTQELVFWLNHSCAKCVEMEACSPETIL